MLSMSESNARSWTTRARIAWTTVQYAARSHCGKTTLAPSLFYRLCMGLKEANNVAVMFAKAPSELVIAQRCTGSVGGLRRISNT